MIGFLTVRSASTTYQTVNNRRNYAKNTNFNTFSKLYFEIGPDLYNFDFNKVDHEEIDTYYNQYLNSLILKCSKQF